MAIPDYQTLMLPLLRLAGDGAEHRFRESAKALAKEFNLTSVEQEQLLPSGTQPLFVNRVVWARFYLVKAGLLQSLRRGYFRITDSGRSILGKPPARLDTAFLRLNYQGVRDLTGEQGVSADRVGRGTTNPVRWTRRPKHQKSL